MMFRMICSFYFTGARRLLRQPACWLWLHLARFPMAMVSFRFSLSQVSESVQGSSSLKSRVQYATSTTFLPPSLNCFCRVRCRRWPNGQGAQCTALLCEAGSSLSDCARGERAWLKHDCCFPCGRGPPRDCLGSATCYALIWKISPRSERMTTRVRVDELNARWGSPMSGHS